MSRWNTVRKFVCVDCGNESETKSLNQKRCGSCKEINKKEYARKYLREKRVSGIGSGNNQGKGTMHHSFKSGIGIFKRIKLESMKELICENCSKDLTDLISDKKKGRYFWCVHHIDGNRENNSLENLKLLCKRCHQLEHNCIDNLPN